jgi:hypothetical protein
MVGLSFLVTPFAMAEDGAPSRTLKDRKERGQLQDAAQAVRGDSGRWNDEEHWLHAPAPDTKAARFSLDDWLLAWSEKKFTATSADDNWLLFSTRQLNDHDRVWIESIERKGNQITVVMQQATWRGKYFKNFTYYQVLGVDLGRLEPGTYEATCIIRPATFSQFDGDGKPLNNWPKDEQPAERPPLKISTTFTVNKKSD